MRVSNSLLYHWYFIFSTHEEDVVHNIPANPPVTHSVSSSASSVPNVALHLERRNDDPLDEMLMESIKVMKGKRASKEPKQKYTLLYKNCRSIRSYAR